MKNFVRVVRLALRNRLTVAAVFFSSLMVGLFWGANISAIYPFVELFGEHGSPQAWVESKISKSREKIDQLSGEIDSLQAKLGADVGIADRGNLEAKISRLRLRREAEQRALAASKTMQPYINRWLPDTAFQTLVIVVAVLLIMTAMKNVFIVWNMNLVEHISQRTAYELRNEFYRRTLRLDLQEFSEEASSDLLVRFTSDVGMAARGVNELFGRATREPLKMAACFIGAALISWRLLLLSLVITPLAVFLVNRLARSIKRANRRAMEGMSELHGQVSETIHGIKVIKAFSTERIERRRFAEISRHYMNKAKRIVFYNALTKPATEVLGIGVICMAILAGAYLVLNQETHLFGIMITSRPLSLGALVAFYALLVGVSDPIRKMSDVYSCLQMAIAASDRVYEKLDREPKIVEPEKPRPLPTDRPTIAFENVHFAYGPGKPLVLRGVDLEIPFGQHVAIVGPNGCGKSTLLNMVPRFFEPTLGAVKLEGVDLRELRTRDIRRNIALVTQQTLLFDDTVLNNIRYGSPEATDEQVLAAAKKAHAHDFIERDLSDGYQTLVGQSGGRLSGGQRQRIALARAILRDPSVILLDEATSQIDVESERLIHEVLQEFLVDRTALIITHRMSALQLADRIVVMDEGRIADHGTHDQLLSRCGLYRSFYEGEMRRSA